jgi:hypothetical protein
MFGGVIDRDIKDDLESRFCDDLYSFDVTRRRWFVRVAARSHGSIFGVWRVSWHCRARVCVSLVHLPFLVSVPMC